MNQKISRNKQRNPRRLVLAPPFSPVGRALWRPPPPAPPRPPRRPVGPGPAVPALRGRRREGSGRKNEVNNG